MLNSMLSWLLQKRPAKDDILVEELQQQLKARYQREASLVCALSERDNLEGELQKRLDVAKRHEEDLEAELANMWALVAKLENSATSEDTLTEGLKVLQTGADKDSTIKQLFGVMKFLRKMYFLSWMRRDHSRLRLLFIRNEKRKVPKSWTCDVLRLKGDNIAGLDITSLEELQNLHVEAITKICHAKPTIGFEIYSLFELIVLAKNALPSSIIWDLIADVLLS
ncbi:kinesin-like protein KIN-7C, mitochondrial [Tanacetum coccineum]